jgi:L-ascorbate metabolism protein UlaG (beta-lactamase superfamily)
MKITMVGNCTALVETGGTKIVTDPYFAPAGSLLYARLTRPTKSREELKDVDLVLISHTHWDHTDGQYLCLLSNSTPVVVPRPAMRSIASQGARNVVGVKAWETWHFGDTTITAVPASHVIPTVGFVVQSDGKQVYFAGDTYYRPFMKEIGRRFQIDVALLPVTSDRIPLTMRARGAVRAVEALSPRVVVPVHLGVGLRPQFLRGNHTIEGFTSGVQKARPGCDVLILQDGQSYEL